LRLPERLARGLLPAEVPELDRPLRFVVDRGNRGAVRAASLEELHELLEQPWMRDELSYSREEGGAGESRAPRKSRGSKKGQGKGNGRASGQRRAGGKNSRGPERVTSRGRRRR
jgi:hypothetical protein